MQKKPTILLLGSTGQLGSLIASRLCNEESITLRVTSKKKLLLEDLARKYGEACFLDFNEPASFQKAFEGVDRLFLLTGYSFSMVTQSKTLIDAAKKAGVEHIVHLGVFSLNEDCSVPHFAWHQMIEAYIKEKGFQWTHLHPNCFLQNLITFSLFKEGKFRWYAGDTPCGWIALEDVAEAAAKILVEGPIHHHKKNYWFSTESLNVFQVAQILSDVTGMQCIADPQSADQFLADLGSGPIDPYMLSVAESFKQIEDGRMACISEVKDDLPTLIGRKSMSVRQWVLLHKSEFLQLADEQAKNIAWKPKF